ncbi:MAG: CidA/LrgA family protein [Glaciecola sp.]|jgi:holin-like protein|nr:CidA/LrgA family protein [Glaciecola sp.]MDG1814508.1 CidA/LrgA family protein [Glaciecola sp.]MDG2099560.1 CidA/LrgA family protein [Glaciecola sp.]
MLSKPRVYTLFQHLVQHIGTLIVLIGAYELGDVASAIIPLPATINGLFILLLVFVVYGKVPQFLNTVIPVYLGHMSMFFVPAIMAVWLFQQAVYDHWLALVLALVLTTIASMVLVMWVSNKLLKATDNTSR